MSFSTVFPSLSYHNYLEARIVQFDFVWAFLKTAITAFLAAFRFCRNWLISSCRVNSWAKLAKAMDLFWNMSPQSASLAGCEAEMVSVCKLGQEKSNRSGIFLVSQNNNMVRRLNLLTCQVFFYPMICAVQPLHLVLFNVPASSAVNNKNCRNV